MKTNIQLFFLILDDNYDDYDEKFRLNDAD